MVRFGVMLGIKAEGDETETTETLREAGKIMGSGPGDVQAALTQLTDEQLVYFGQEVTSAALLAALWAEQALAEAYKRKGNKDLANMPADKLAMC